MSERRVPARARLGSPNDLRGFGFFRRLGPGLVTGAADDDPGGIGTYSQVGAAYGFQFLWAVLVCYPFAVAVQEATARLALTTRTGLSTLIKKRYNKAVLYWAVALVVVANTFNIAADIGAMADSLRLGVAIPRWSGVVFFGVVIVGLEITFRYRSYERILKWLAFSILAYVGVAVVVRADIWVAAKATLVPTLTLSAGSLVALTAVFGTTISPYLFFWQSAEEVEEEKSEIDLETEGRRSSHRGIAEMRVDVASGMGAGVFVGMCIVYAAAATLHQSGITDVATASQAAEALRPIAGDFSAALFAAGIIGTGLLAVPVLAGSSAYALADAFGWESGLSAPLRKAPTFYGVIAVGVGIGVVMNLLGLPAVRALYWSAVLNGIAAPPLMLLINLLASSDEVTGEHSSKWLSKAWLWAGTVVMTLSAVGSMVLAASGLLREP
jgi:NRAMP (natural resistance-associated macrophage protein)-like metal ion transporter